jgi:ankyrin repeat protein
MTPARRFHAAILALPLVLSADAPAHAEAPTCRDLQQRFETQRSDLVAAQTNLMLLSAAEMGCVELARRLMAAGASLESRDRLGNMALARAARSGNLALVELFLAQGAAIDARNLVGATALYFAAENERPATVRLLLSKGADANLAGRSGVTPLAAAAFKGNERIVEYLLAGAANPDVVDATGKSAITYAAARGFVAIVKRLLEAGVDAKRSYGNGLTALMWAAGNEEGVGARAVVEVVDLLLDHQAPIDAADVRGRTALMIAAELGHTEVVERLVRRGADRTLRDRNGKRAVDLAANDQIRTLFAGD